MGLRVLGPLSCDGDVAFGRRDRAVLTALAMYAGRSLSADQLAEAVWGDDLPPSAHKALQGCVVRLRKALGADGIKTSPQGYRLDLSTDEIDSHRFERMVERSRELLALGEPERAAYLLTQALDLWRGRAFEDVESWDRAIIEAGRLDELRLEAEELRVDAYLRTGRHQEVLAAAESMVNAAPLRERRWTLLAWAQYQDGRQSEALRTLHRVKSLLADKLGLDPGPDLAALEEAILRQDDALLGESARPTSPTCPYQGLTPYEIDDAELFYGRESDLDVCLDMLKRHGSMTVVGPSGCGKSSLVRAGIGAALCRDGRPVVVVTPGEHPMLALAAASDPAPRSVLLVDQCEEVFSLCNNEAERDAFLSSLVHFAEHGALVVAMRGDRLTDVSAYPDFARLVERSLHLLGGMSEQGLREAVEAPARQAGLLIEPGLVDLLVGEVEGTPGALPLLSHALLETWKRREGNTMTVAGYVATGGIRGAVAQSAEKVYSSLEPPQRPVLRDLVLRLVTSGTEGEPVRSPVPRRLISADPEHEHLIDLLVTSRLVTSDAGVVEIAHEALARAWPRLRAWLDDDVEGQRILHHLSGAADAWDSMGRPDSELYRGVRLTQALQWKASKDTTLTDAEVAFLEAGDEKERSEQRAAEIRARSQARLIRRLRGVLAAGAVLLVAAILAGVLAVRQADRADSNAAAAEENAAAAADNALAADARRAGAKALATDDIGTSMLLAVAGAQLDDTAATQANLLAVLAQRQQLTQSVPYDGDVIVGLEMSPDGQTLAVYDRRSQVTLYDANSWEILHTFAGGDRVPWKWFAPMAFSPDGATLAVGTPPLSPDPIRLLDGQTLEPRAQQLPGLPSRGARAADITFSADGSSVAAVIQRLRRLDGYWDVVGADLLAWDLSSPGRPIVRTRQGSVCHKDWGYRCLIANSPDGDTVYTSTPLKAYDVATGTQRFVGARARFGWGGDRRSNFFDLSPDGTMLAMADESNRILLLDAGTGSVLRSLNGHGEAVLGVRFSGDGTLLASSSADQTAMVWDVATGEIRERLQLGEGDAQALAFSRDDTTLYSAGADLAIREWDLSGARRFVSEVAAPRNALGTLTPSPGARFLSLWWLDYLRFYDVAERRWSPLVGTDQEQHLGVTWNSGGTRFASVGVDFLDIWDPSTGALVEEASLDGEYAGVRFSPDDSRIAILSSTGRVSMRDAKTLEPIGEPVQLDVTGGAVSLSGDNHTALLLVPGYVSDLTFEHFNRTWVIVDLEAGRVIGSGELSFDASWLATSPDGRHAVITGRAGELVVLDLATGKTLGPPVVGHSSEVWTIQYSPDGSRIVTGGTDGSVSLWDGVTGELLGTVLLPEQTTASAAFGADEQTVVISTQTPSMYRWDTRVDHAIEFACRLAGRDLTEAEWQENFGSRPYEETCPTP